MLEVSRYGIRVDFYSDVIIDRKRKEKNWYYRDSCLINFYSTPVPTSDRKATCLSLLRIK